MTKQDWANLSTDLVVRIGALLLADDVTEYIRLRSVCRPWRSCTNDPKNLGGCFHPRKWIMLTPPNSPATTAFDFVNFSTRMMFSIDLLELRRGYSLVYVVDGLCLLQNKRTRVLALLNPFTRFLIHLPKQVRSNPWPVPFLLEHAPGTLSGAYITSSSTVVLRFDGDGGDWIRLVYAKPGDDVWLSVDMKIMFSDSMLYRDQLYVIDVKEGLVRINLHCGINSQTPVADVVIPCGSSLCLKNSYLVECDGKVILVTMPYMFQVDLEERRLVSIKLIDGYALFLASQRSLSIYCKNLFCSHDNYIYFCEQSPNVINVGRNREQLMAPFYLEYARLQPRSVKFLTTTNPSDMCPLVEDLVLYQKLRSIQNYKGW